MKTVSEIVGLSFTDRLMAKLKGQTEIFSYLGMGVLSLLLSTSVLFGQIAPFGIAVVAAANNTNVTVSVLGCVIGYLLVPGVAFKMKYIAIVLIVGGIKWALSFKKGSQTHPVISPLLACIVLGAIGFFVLQANEPTTYDFILLISEILLVGGSTYFFSQTLRVLKRNEHFSLLRSDLNSIIITFGLVIVALCSFHIGTVSLGRILAALIILICALKGGEAGGSMGGVTAGVAACLADNSFAFLMGSYGFGGLIAGVFSRFGRFGCAAAFIIVNGLATALTSLMQPTTLGPVIEVFIASVIFILLPSCFFKKLAFAPGSEQTRTTDSIKSLLLNRLYAVKKALGDVASITEKVSGKLQKLENPPFDLNAAVADQVCAECPKKMLCWQEGFESTSASLNDLNTLLRHGAVPSLDNLPAYLHDYCLDPQGILDIMSDLCREQRRIDIGYARNLQLRSIVLDQWSGVEQLIGDISSDISCIALQDEHTAARVREYLHRRSIDSQALSCYKDASEHLIIELSVQSIVAQNLDKTELTFDFSEICNCELSIPVITEFGSCCVYVFCERAHYRLNTGVTQICSSGKRLCGDSFKFMDECGGRAMVILSDGMGSGSLAAIDSSMATSLISRLASAHVSLEAALRLVNSAMLVKSGDESLATIDICSADLYHGCVTLYKAGAAPSYVRKSGRVGFVESSSLPAGILNPVEFQQTALSLTAGDMVVLVSDGVTQTGEEWVLDELERFEGNDMQWLCERIASLAKLRRTQLHDDDITVFALMLDEMAS